MAYYLRLLAIFIRDVLAGVGHYDTTAQTFI